MNNFFYQVIPLERTYLKKQKKRPHISAAGWWGTLFLNQILEKCNPLSVVQLIWPLYTTDSALIIFFICEFINTEIILKLKCLLMKV